MRRRELQRPLKWYQSEGALTRNERLARKPCRLITNGSQRNIHGLRFPDDAHQVQSYHCELYFPIGSGFRAIRNLGRD